MNARFTTLAAALLLVSISAHAQETDDDTLKFVERATTDVTLDLGAKGDSAGDTFIFANEVYDAKNKTKVGNTNGWCIRTVPGKAMECFWTLILKEGQITAAGPFLDAADSNLAVTGGTGDYANVGGEVKIHARDAKHSAYDLTYTLEDNDDDEDDTQQ